MKGKKAQLSAVSVLTLILVIMASVVPAFAQDVKANVFAEKSIEATKIVWQPLVGYGGAVLTFVGPDDQAVNIKFGADRKPTLNNVDAQGSVLADGVYNYELMILRPDANTPPSDFDAEKRGVVDWEGTTEAVVESGTFSVLNGAFVTQDASEGESGGEAAPANDINDILHLDDVIIDGSLCVGFDCVNGESFGFDTIRLKENNLRIKFDDTSSSASFPNRDWQITINDSANGGLNKFSIDDITGSRTPFTIEAGAPSHSLYVDDGGRLGLGTSTPVVDAHVKSGNTPTLRLEQDGSSGFTPQTWDVAGNEAGFFIRDATNGSTLPFRILPTSPSNALVVDGDGEVGVGTLSPDAELDIESSSSPGFRLSNTGTAGGSWDVFMNSNTGRFNIRDNSSGNIPFKFDQGAAENLLQLGVNASNEVTINGNLVVTGQCTEVDGACAPDYVFSAEYDLMTLAELKAYIAANSHLPNVPSGKELDAKGVNIQEFSYTLLEKIEELTLYTLQQQEIIEQQQQTIENLEARLDALEARLDALESTP